MYKIHKLKNGECYQYNGKINSLIECVFIETYFTKVENQGVGNRIVPDNTVELILTNKNFQRNFSDGKRNKLLLSHLSGLKTKWQEIVLEGSPLISIRFKPEVVYQLSLLPAVECRNQAVGPRAIFGPDFVHFEDELFGLNTTKERLNLIEKYFTAKLIQVDIREDNLFQYAKASIDESLGKIRINRLADELKVSQKSLENKFNQFIGVTPKQYCRLVRFISIVKNHHSSVASLTSCAYENHFYDQSHFIKEINWFTGLSPSAYFSQKKGIQEDIF